jgi:multicomponent Na+:H+ antiporter subunit G
MMGDVVTATLVLGGAFFFLAGTVGLLRFPDTLSRLHALTKADNLGLGLVVLGLAVHADAWAVRAKLILIWVLVLGATVTTAHLVARTALEHGAAGPDSGGTPHVGPDSGGTPHPGPDSGGTPHPGAGPGSRHGTAP